MNIRCEYCGRTYPETEEKCPYCGAPNGAALNAGSVVPRSIEELQAFCDAHHLPLREMRFFIGEDYHGARAFGIYKDESGVCTVYKNKSDGSRSVRYCGTDEAYAVMEIYQKLREEIRNQRSHRYTSYTPPRQTVVRPTNRRGSSSKAVGLIVWIVIALVMVSFFLSFTRGSGFPFHSRPGFSISFPGGFGFGGYDYEDNTYSYGDYSSYDEDSGSQWNSDWDDDWDDSDWDWDSGDSWDSGWTDWDSDW